MGPTNIVENTERTQFYPQTDKVKPVYPPFNFVEAGGIKIQDHMLRMASLHILRQLLAAFQKINKKPTCLIWKIVYWWIMYV